MSVAGSGPRIGFLSALNYYSRDAFSGILWKMHDAMVRHGMSVVDLGRPFHPNLLTRVSSKLSRVTGMNRRYPDGFSISESAFADLVRRQLKTEGCDVAFAPVASTEVALVQPEIPVVYASDATYRIAAATYFAHHTAAESEQAESNERRSIESATELIYASQWAADSAVRDYGADPTRVSVIPYGANLIADPDRSTAIRRRPSPPLRMLFLGRDWTRKGGPLVEATHNLLTSRGIDAHLTIVGCNAPGIQASDSRRIIPFLSKDTAAGRRQFEALWQSTDVFFLPTRGDTFGIVFCEAAAHGIPVVTTNVGGTGSVVINDATGFVLPLEAGPEQYADVIARLASDPSLYERMSRAARDRYETSLNWSAWANGLERVIDRAVT